MCKDCEFKDVSKAGKDRKWKERKLQNINLAERLETLGYRNFNNVYQCSEVLRFREQEDKSLKLHQAWFCKNRLCPICNWRRSMKYSVQLSEMIDKAIQIYPKSKFIFLTLTCRNCEGDELKETLSAMTQGFNRLVKYKKVDKNLLGYIRATETTYSEKWKNYHPHIHVLLMIQPNYFNGKENYIKQEEWIALWQKAMKLDYKPSVDVRKVYAKKHNQSYIDAVKEVAKYPTKPIEKMGTTEEEKLQITDDLSKGLYKKRQLGFGGIFKKIRKELHLDDIENGDLINVENDDEKESTLGQEIVAQWNWERKNYFIV